jgi:hypothetical protein
MFVNVPAMKHQCRKGEALGIDPPKKINIEGGPDIIDTSLQIVKAAIEQSSALPRHR